MSDVEKNQHEVVAPEVEIRRQDSKFITLLKGNRNDPNILGKELYEKALQYDEAQLERDAIKVRWKLDLMILPLVSLTRMANSS